MTSLPMQGARARMIIRARADPDGAKQSHAQPPCGAQTRSGKPCSNIFTLPNGRCRMHGGTNPGAPKGNQRARTHGIYSKHITPEEEADLALIDLETLDDVLAVTRVLLLRVLAAEAAAAGKPELYSVTRIFETPKGNKVVTERVRDFMPIMLRMIARIERLTILRRALIDGAGTPAS